MAHPGATSTQDHELEATMRTLLERRGREKTICPSEVARAVGGEGWHELMEPVRALAGRLAAEGELEVTQRGRPVDPAGARGPIRLRLAGGAR